MPKASQQKQIVSDLGLFALLQLAEPDEAELLRTLGLQIPAKFLQPPFVDRNMDITEETLSILSCIISSRYLRDRTNRISKPRHNLLWFNLNIYKTMEPALFREHLRIEPAVFNSLVAGLSTHPVFHNQTMNEQVPVEEQVAIALY